MPSLAARICFSPLARDFFSRFFRRVWAVCGWAFFVPVVFLALSWGIQFGFGTSREPVVLLAIATGLQLAAPFLSWLDPNTHHPFSLLASRIGRIMGACSFVRTVVVLFNAPNTGNWLSFAVDLCAVVFTEMMELGRREGERRLIKVVTATRVP
ncbi:hypothetical protein BKA65DRAFT_584259 [Rhexocercosporidium sp. MPI-PUGE-AT-0058]|nr:hypothetical protein BKA65DRAFT_584259 [Rhexocercosporidium sp. MPI-PUGE-AT-0058]